MGRFAVLAFVAMGCNNMNGDALSDARFDVDAKGRARLEFTDHPKGFVDYSVLQGENVVLLMEREERRLGTTVALVTELVLEVKRDVPVGREVDAASWIVRALYRYGGPQLQFESTRFDGMMTVESKAEETTLHGRLSLRFFEPSIDLAHSGDARVDTPF